MKRSLSPLPLWLLLLFLATLSALFLFSCQDERSTEKSPIRIGVFQSLSGADASFGQDALNGIRLAEQEINSQGGVLGRPLELVVRDNQSKAGETSFIVRELISRRRVVALIGEVSSSRTFEAAPIAQRSGIPLIANSASNEKVTQIGDFIFRATYRDSQQGEAHARYLHSLGKSRAAIFVDITKDYSTTIAKSFKKAFTALGGTIVAEQNYNAGDKIFLQQLTAIQHSHPDCLFIPGYHTEVASILEQKQSLGLQLDTFGTDACESPDLLQIAGHAAEGMVVNGAFSPEDPTPLVQSFVEKYHQRYGILPSTACTATGYDALLLLVDAIRRAGSTNPKAIRNALAVTQEYPGVTGSFTFEKDSRDPSKPIVFLRIQDGKYRFIKK